jgi:uncharacterized protein
MPIPAFLARGAIAASAGNVCLEEQVAQFRVFRDVRGEYRWRLRAANNEIIADSAEGYTTKTKCLEGIAFVKRDAPDAPVYDDTGEAAAYRR